VQDTNILFFVLGSLDFVSRLGPVSLVVKKSKRTQHERRERERERKRQKKVVGSGVVLRAQQRCAGIGIVSAS